MGPTNLNDLLTNHLILLEIRPQEIRYFKLTPLRDSEITRDFLLPYGTSSDRIIKGQSDGKELHAISDNLRGGWDQRKVPRGTHT